MLGFNGKYPETQPKNNLRQFLVKNCKKSAGKYSIEKPTILGKIFGAGWRDPVKLDRARKV